MGIKDGGATQQVDRLGLARSRTARRSGFPGPGKQITIHACNWHTPCCVMAARIETTTYPETPMNTLSSKFTAFAAALVMNSLIMGAVGYLFEIQSHPQMSVIAFAKAVVAHQWLI
jgi:hypothetical protein